MQFLSHRAFELSSLVIDGDVAGVWWGPLDFGRVLLQTLKRQAPGGKDS